MATFKLNDSEVSEEQLTQEAIEIVSRCFNKVYGDSLILNADDTRLVKNKSTNNSISVNFEVQAVSDGYGGIFADYGK